MIRNFGVFLFLLAFGFGAAGEGAPAAGEETFSLMQYWTAKHWWCMTSTLTQVPDAAPPRLRWHVLVDYKGGEPSHPIGWPLADAYFRDLPEALRDWRQFDRLTFRARAGLSRSSEESLPVYLQFCEKGGRRLYKEELPGLVPGKEVLISIDLSRAPELEKSAMFRFYVYEAQFQHGDQLELELWDIRLHRGKTIRAEEFFLSTPSLFEDAPRLAGEVRITGPEALLKQGIPVAVSRPGDAKVLTERRLFLHRGRQMWELDLAPLNLLPGEYRITLFPDDPVESVERMFTIVSSPWKEASK